MWFTQGQGDCSSHWQLRFSGRSLWGEKVAQASSLRQFERNVAITLTHFTVLGFHDESTTTALAALDDSRLFERRQQCIPIYTGRIMLVGAAPPSSARYTSERCTGCEEIIVAFEECHAKGFLWRSMGMCNDAKRALSQCLRQERQRNQTQNRTTDQEKKEKIKALWKEIDENS